MWQAVWNWNDHNQGHGIALHPDECDTYSSWDPITSFSFGHGGVLTLSDRKAAASKMLFQADGDALVMAGDFQSEFWHGVPERPAGLYYSHAACLMKCKSGNSVAWLMK